MAFCIPRKFAEGLKSTALRGELDIQKLYDMSPSERREFFAKHTNQDIGKFLNIQFEKAMASKQRNAFSEFVKSSLALNIQKKPQYNTILDKIEKLREIGVLSPEGERRFSTDIISDSLGVSVSPKEVRRISELAIEVQRTQAKVKDEIGNPDYLQENLDFFKAKKQIDDYLQEINPQHQLKILTSTIGRGSMLASLKSPILNIESNTIFGVGEALVRRLSTGKLNIPTSMRKLAVDNWKMGMKIYQETGYDISRAMDLRDLGPSGERVMTDITHSMGKGPIRKAGRFFEKYVFKGLMGTPDVAFSLAHQADSLALNSLKQANGNTIKAMELMQDAMRITPRTLEGEILRSQGVLDATYATYTNKSWATKLTLGIRDLVNKATGDLRVGDYLMPFVKTPANVIAAGIDYAGGSAIKATISLVYAIKNKQLHEKPVQTQILRDTVRGGMGFLAATLIVANIKEDDFVGAYDPTRAQIEGLKNSVSNSVKIGDKWISLDYFGPLAIPMSAMLNAKKYGNTAPDKVLQYGLGIKSQFLKLPGLDIYKDISDVYKPTKDATFKEKTTELGSATMLQLKARLIPSILPDFAKGIDTYERDTSSAINQVKASIPGIRQTLPIKYDVFGEPVKTESFLSVLTAGSRIKTSNEDALVLELSRLYNSDYATSLVDLSRTTRKKVLELKNKVSPEKFIEIKIEYGNDLKKHLDDLINSSKYKNAEDSKKQDLIQSETNKIVDKHIK